MKRSSVSILLLVVNVALAAGLVWRLHGRPPEQIAPEPAAAEALQQPAAAESSEKRSPASPQAQTNATPFTAVYSADPKRFAENLRAIRCPDQTVRDIVTAEVHRRFQAQEEALRPTPADHVPFAWSARTTERRLLERRVQAALLARQEAALLREALGCDANVPMPIYAMTTSDEQFETQLAAAPGLDACSIRQVQDTYWIEVQALLQKTKGFWLPQDLAELEGLKLKRKMALNPFFSGQ